MTDSPGPPPPARDAPGARHGPDSGGDPLSAEDRLQLEVANARVERLRGALRIASFNGVTIGLFAFLSLVVAAASLVVGSPGPTAWVMGIGMAVIARNEFRGRRRLRALDPGAGKLLGWNQVAFMTLLVLYCGWSIYLVQTRPLEGIEEIEKLTGPIAELVKEISTLVYALVALLSVLFQGGNALYYFRRGRVVAEHLETTPDWIVGLQRANPPI